MLKTKRPNPQPPPRSDITKLTTAPTTPNSRTPISKSFPIVCKCYLFSSFINTMHICLFGLFCLVVDNTSVISKTFQFNCRKNVLSATGFLFFNWFTTPYILLFNVFQQIRWYKVYWIVLVTYTHSMYFIITIT